MSYGFNVLDELYATLRARTKADPAASYTAALLKSGLPRVARKFGEEAVELIIAALADKKSDVTAEAADVLYHLLVLFMASGVKPVDVMKGLKARMNQSGIAEKLSRGKKIKKTSKIERKT